MRKLPLLLLLSVLGMGSLSGAEDPFARALNAYGTTGFAAVPHADVLPPKRWALGIHNFSPEAVVAWPWLPGELGTVTTLRENEDLGDALEEMAFNLKLRVLSEERVYASVAGGLECSRPEKPRFFIVLDRQLPLVYGRILAGYGWRDGRGRLDGAFYGLGVTVYRGLQLLGEYDGDDANLGVRLMLSPRIKIDALCLGLRALKRQTNVRSVFDDNLNLGLSIDMALRRPWKKKKESD